MALLASYLFASIAITRSIRMTRIRAEKQSTVAMVSKAQPSLICGSIVLSHTSVTQNSMLVIDAYCFQ